MFTEDKVRKIKEDSRSLVSAHQEFFNKLQLESIAIVFSLVLIYLIPYLGTRLAIFYISNTILLLIFVLIAPFALFASHFYSFYLYHSLSSLYFGKKLLARKECYKLWSSSIKSFLHIETEILLRSGLNTMLSIVLTYLALFFIGILFKFNPAGGLNYLFLTISALIGLVVFIFSRVNYTYSTVIFIDSLNNEEMKSPKAVVRESEKCVKSIGNNEIFKYNLERPFSFMEYKSGAYLYLLYRFLISGEQQ